MKKLILMASALALAGAAHAQDMSQPGTTTPAPAMPDASMPPAAPGAMSMPMTPDASAPPAAPMTPDAGTPAVGQDGAAPPATSGADTAASSPSSGDLPTCSQSVTDNCKEGGGMHHARKHRRHK